MIGQEAIDDICQRFDGNGHPPGISMQQTSLIDHEADMARKEDQVAAHGRFVSLEDTTKRLPLLIAVARAGAPRQRKCDLDKARTVDTAIATPTPEIRRAKKAHRGSNEVIALCTDRHDMALMEVAKRSGQKIAFHDAFQAGAQAQHADGSRFDIRRRKDGGRVRCDHMGRKDGLAQRVEPEIAHIMIMTTISPGPTASMIEDEELLAEQQLRTGGRIIARRCAQESGWSDYDMLLGGRIVRRENQIGQGDIRYVPPHGVNTRIERARTSDQTKPKPVRRR